VFKLALAVLTGSLIGTAIAQAAEPVTQAVAEEPQPTLADPLEGSTSEIEQVRAEVPALPTPAKPDVEAVETPKSLSDSAVAPSMEAAKPMPNAGDKKAAKAKAKAVKKDANDPTTDEQRVLDMVNAERRRWGRGPLRLNRALMRVARRHASNMARYNQMSHSLGGSVSQRIAQDGTYMRSAGENIAQGQRGADQVMNTWLASSGHRNNILSTGYTDIGVAVAYNSWGTPYWVQVFATP
jgi:uncharacterized protein YkwD